MPPRTIDQPHIRYNNVQLRRTGCPKCSYVRQASDFTVCGECPACGHLSSHYAALQRQKMFQQKIALKQSRCARRRRAKHRRSSTTKRGIRRWAMLMLVIGLAIAAQLSSVSGSATRHPDTLKNPLYGAT